MFPAFPAPQTLHMINFGVRTLPPYPQAGVVRARPRFPSSGGPLSPLNGEEVSNG